MTLADLLARAIADGATCPECGSTTALRVVLMENGPHFAKAVCDDCRERFVTWLRKPTTAPRARDGRRKDLLEVVRADRDGEPLYCEVCLRDERFLPTGVWMEAHHVLEHQDGGLDTPKNLVPLCNECHQLIHWRRRTVAGGEQVGKERESVNASG